MVLHMALGLLLWLTPGMAQPFVQGFEDGLGGAQSYFRAPDDAPLALGTDGPAEGKQYLRCTLPGKSKLEGFSVTAAGLSGGRLATVTAKVRGTGQVWLCLISRNGWLYSPATTALTDQWQEVALSKVLVAADTGLDIYFISQTVQPGAVFEVDDIRVSLADPPQAYDAAVGPWLLQGEDFVTRRDAVADDAAAGNGRVARAEKYLSLAGLPFPRTQRPVSVCVRVRPAGKGDAYRITTDQGGNTQTLATLAPGTPGEWQWLRFPPLTAGEVGDCFGLACEGDKAAADPLAVDAVVLGTTPDLSDEQLAAAPGLFARRPLVVASRTDEAPRVDGDPRDPCWQRTVACTGFIAMGSQLPAQEPTEARFCYDDRCLYALITCREPILTTAQQRRHEFLATVTRRDGEVFADDSAILLLDPTGTAKTVYDFTVNALGAIADSRDAGPDLWGSRDLAWNSGAVAQGRIGEGEWTVELAIPFGDLGGTPRLGEAWSISLGHLAKARKEQSTWNPCNRGIHEPWQWGTVVFGGTTPGVVCEAPGSLQPGRNELAASLGPAGERSGGVYLATCLTAAGVPQWSRAFHPFGGDTEAVRQRFDVSQETEVRLAHAVLDAATLAPLYLTPELARAVKSSLASVRLSCAGPYELTLNDEVISRGPRAEAAVIKAPLQRGANMFALRLEQGTAAVAVETPGLTVTGESWRMAPADTTGAALAATDDAGWRAAVKLDADPQPGPTVGEAGKPMVLRLTLLWEKTRVWPSPQPAFYLARGAPQHFSVIADGLKGRTLDQWSTYIATPPEFEVLGSTGFYGVTSPGQPRFVCEQLGERDVRGRTMRVAKITADKPVLAGRHYIMSLFNAFVRYREEAGEPKSPEAEFLYWSEANGGSVVEAPQSFRVRLLPRLNGAQPKKLVLQLWGGWLSNMDDLGLREEVLRAAQQAGFNDIVGGDRWSSDNASRFNLRHTLGMNFEPWSLNLAPYLKDHPEQRLVDSAGKLSDQYLCMSLLTGDAWPAVEAALRNLLDTIRPDTVDYDFEYPPLTSHHSCYCPRCLQAFRDFAKLPADAELTPAAIRQRFGPQWVDFMSGRVAGLFARLKETIHRLAPGTSFSVYSGYATPDNAERYGVDWRKVGDLQACDHAGCGYGRPAADIQATIAALQGIPLTCGCLIEPYETDVTTPQTPLTSAWALRMLLDSTGGILVYDRLSFDGRTWYAMGEVSRLAAAHEDLFLTGRRAALPGHDSADVQVLSDGTTTLVCVLNETGQPVSHTLALPAEAGGGQEFYTGQTVAAGATVTLSVEPGQARVYVLRKA